MLTCRAGQGAVYTYDPVGNFERVGYSCQVTACTANLDSIITNVIFAVPEIWSVMGQICRHVTFFTAAWQLI